MVRLQMVIDVDFHRF